MKAAHPPSTRAKRERRAAATAPPNAAPPPAESRDAFIRRTAYAYFEARGRIHGHELDDWLQAEAEFERMTAASAGNAQSGH